MAVVFTPPQGNRALPSKLPADPWASPQHARATVPQVPRNQRRPEGRPEGSRQYQSGGGGSSMSRPAPQGQRPQRAGQRKASPEGDTRWYREMVRETEDEKRRVEEELKLKNQEEASLAMEVQHLRDELEKERAETDKAMQPLNDRFENEQRESTRMQMIFMKAQLGGTTVDDEAAYVKQDVMDKTNDILEAMREIREQQQQAFKQVKSLSYAMLKACSQPTPGATSSTAVGPVSSAGSDIGRGTVFVTGTRSPCRSPARSPPRSPPSSVINVQHMDPGRGPSPPGSLVGGRLSPPGSLVGGRHSPPGSDVGGRHRRSSDAGGRQRSPSLRTVLESEGQRRMPSQAQRSASPSVLSEDGQRRWFKQMQANLEQFGDVEVFAEDSSQECMCCNQMIASNYRVRPRKCSHVFHIECLLHWWTEGTCPVCHVSFAPEQDEAGPEARLTERSSSTSAARLQMRNSEAAYRHAQHRKRRSPQASPQSQPRAPPSDAGFRPSPIAEAFQHSTSPVTRSMSQPQQSHPL